MYKQKSDKLKLEYTHRYSSPLGEITIASDGKALLGVWFDGQKYFGSTLAKTHALEGANDAYLSEDSGIHMAKEEQKSLAIFQQTDKWLDIYFSGKAPDFTPLMHINTTAFRRAVWEILLTIPFGQTMTYGEVAKKIAKQRGVEKMSAQAVGGAVGHNPFSIIIPCHRVVGAKGELTGYGGGLDKKEWLLAMEEANYVYSSNL